MNTINWEDSSWKQLYLVGDEEVISLLHTKVYVFSDSVLCLGKVNQNPTSSAVWEDKLSWFKDSHGTELWTQLTENRWNSSGIFSQDSLHWSLSANDSKDKLTSSRCSMTSHGDLKTMKRNVLLIVRLCLYSQTKIPAGHW